MAESRMESVAFRADPETVQAIEDYAEAHNMEESDALRQACDEFFVGWQRQHLAGEMKRFGTYAAAVLIGVQLGTPINVEPWIVAFLITVLGVVGYEQSELTVSQFLPARVQQWVGQ